MKKTASLSLFSLFCFTLAFGGMTRLFQGEPVSIEHFDEGVYASNLFIGPPEYRYPFQPFYAPPLLPAITEWICILSGSNPVSIMLFHAMLGVLLVLAIGWTTAQLLNRDRTSEVPVSVVVAVLLALMSELLIQYSRAALTDTMLAFLLTVAVGCGTRGLRSQDWKWIVAAGVVTSLAWWTKYNGWLPIAILGAGLAGWIVLESREWKKAPAMLLQWGVLTGIAILLWLPCLQGLQSIGGYAAVSANHAGYVVGFPGWLSSLQRHLEVDHYYSRTLTAVGFFFAIVFALQRRLPAMNGAYTGWSLTFTIGALVVGGLLSLLVWSVGAIPVLAALTLMGVVLFFLDWRRGDVVPRDRLGYWILAAWILGLLFATPLYRPYPRLILPLLTGLIIGAAAGVELLLLRLVRFKSLLSPQRLENEHSVGSSAKSFSRLWPSGMAMGMTLGLVAVCLIDPWTVRSPAYEGRTQLQDIADQILESIHEDLHEFPRGDNGNSDGRVQGIVAVYGEPGLFFHLARPTSSNGRFLIQPIGTTAPLLGSGGDNSVPTYLITGPHSREAAAELARHPDRVRLVDQFDYLPSSLVLLDDISPVELSPHPADQIQVWTQLR